MTSKPLERDQREHYNMLIIKRCGFNCISEMHEKVKLRICQCDQILGNKFHFGKFLNSFGNFVVFVFDKILNLPWHFCYWVKLGKFHSHERPNNEKII